MRDLRRLRARPSQWGRGRCGIYAKGASIATGETAGSTPIGGASIAVGEGAMRDLRQGRVHRNRRECGIYAKGASTQQERVRDLRQGRVHRNRRGGCGLCAIGAAIVPGRTTVCARRRRACARGGEWRWRRKFAAPPCQGRRGYRKSPLRAPRRSRLSCDAPAHSALGGRGASAAGRRSAGISGRRGST